MPNIYQGTVTAVEGRFAVVVSRFNEIITSRLLEGAVGTLVRHGVREENIDVVWVPGAFEIPTLAGHLAGTGRYAAVICLGAVIRGETTHDQHINRAVSTVLAQLGAEHQLPVLFGILTCDTLQQALARSGGSAATSGKDQTAKRVGNKGVDCAEAALEMVHLMAQLRNRPDQESS